MDETVLYRNSKHGISRWTIWQDDNTIRMKSEAKIGDTPMYFSEVVEEGKAGRSLQQQIELRMKARIRGKIDNGYVHTREEAQNPNLKNVMGHHQPMLAQKLKDVKKFRLEDYYIQPKLDGHRCMIVREGGELIAYSRRGREITTINHLLPYIDIPEGVTLDGELYVHGQPLQTIASWAKRLQPDSAKLNYIVFDVVEDVPFRERLRMIEQDLRIPPNGPFSMLDTLSPVSEDVVLNTMFRAFRDSGYEGAILRHGDYPYEIGRRSRGLIKMKETFDDEFQVVDITPSVDNWAVLHCRTDDGKVFKVSAPGTVEAKKHVLAKKFEFIGTYVTVEYAHLTKEGIPFHPVALRWREDL